MHPESLGFEAACDCIWKWPKPGGERVLFLGWLLEQILTVWSSMDEDDLLSSCGGMPNTYFMVRAEILHGKECRNSEHVPVIKTSKVLFGVSKDYTVGLKGRI